MSRCYCTLLRAATRKVASVYDEALAPYGINVAQYSLLRGVERLQPVSLVDLARHLQLDRSTIGRNVRVIERMKLIEMRRSDLDQREALVALTPAGVELLEYTRPVWEDCQHAMESRLGPVKITALQDILRSV